MAKQKYHGNKAARSGFGKACLANKLDYDRKLGIGMQMCADAAALALDDVFDLSEPGNEGKGAAFLRTFSEKLNAISGLLNSDGKDDAELTYSTATIDRALEQIVGTEHFTPWEERYGR